MLYFGPWTALASPTMAPIVILTKLDIYYLYLQPELATSNL